MSRIKQATQSKKMKGFRLQWVLSQAAMMKKMKAGSQAIFAFLTQNGFGRAAAGMQMKKLPTYHSATGPESRTSPASE